MGFLSNKYPIGTKVAYIAVKDKHPNYGHLIKTKTRSTAWIMGCHSAMVMIEGVSGGVSLDHVEICSNVDA